MAENKSQPSYQDLKAEVDRLTAALSASQADATEAQKRASIIQSNEESVPTGKTVMVTRVRGYEESGFHDDGRRILKPKYHEVEEPTFWFTIDMPPVGGTDIKLNGREFYHGSTYEVTLDELRTLMEMVHRLWVHERSIHEDNEKSFRQHFDSRLRKFFPRGDAVNGRGKKVLN